MQSITTLRSIYPASSSVGPFRVSCIAVAAKIASEAPKMLECYEIVALSLIVYDMHNNYIVQVGLWFGTGCDKWLIKKFHLFVLKIKGK